MNTSLKHLPENKQDELNALAELFRAPEKVKMLILFGSYARGSWVQDRYLEKGIIFEYESDYDLLILMDNEDMSLQNHFENRIKKELVDKGLLKTPVSCIFHGIDRVNEALSDGHYFFVDIQKEGIALVDKGEMELVQPRILSPTELQEKALNYYKQWFNSADDFIYHFDNALATKRIHSGAFLLHQATERLYNTILLVYTGYRPKTHSLEALSYRAEMLNEEFKRPFPKNTEKEKNLFRLLHRAYIDARYKMDEYQITETDLIYLGKRVKLLQELTGEICRNQIKSFGK